MALDRRKLQNILWSGFWADDGGSGGGTPSPSQIGEFINIDFTNEANLNDWTAFTDGTTAFTLDGDYVKITGSPSGLFPLDNYLQYDRVLGLENLSLEVDFVIKSYGATNGGFAVGIIGDDTISGTPRSNWYYHFRNTGSGITGEVYRSLNGTSTVLKMTNAITPVVDSTYTFKLDKIDNEYQITLTRTDVVETDSGSETYTYSNTSGTLTLPSAKFFFGTVDQDTWVSDFRVSSTSLKDIDYILVHDSIGAGYCSTANSNRWLDEVEVANPSLSFTRSGGQGDKISTANKKTLEYSLVNASKAILHIGTNSVVSAGVPTSTADYDTLVTNLIAAGVTEFIHISALPRLGNADINTFNTHISTNYNSGIHTYIDVNTTMNNGSDELDAAYDCGDGVHPNDAGQTVISDAVNLVL